MGSIGRGVIAGFLTTLALSLALDPMTIALRTAEVLPPAFAWLLHFFVGSFIWGAGFALIRPALPSPAWLAGLLFGILAWALVMVFIMPVTRAGFFAWQLGPAAPALMLAVHLLHGGLLGVIFGALAPRSEADERDDSRSESRTGLRPLHH